VTGAGFDMPRSWPVFEKYVAGFGLADRLSSGPATSGPTSCHAPTCSHQELSCVIVGARARRRTCETELLGFDGDRIRSVEAYFG
jgi:hypothetical protein